MKVLVVVLAATLVVEVAIGVVVIGGAGDIGVDFRFYRDAAQRWLSEGSFYLPHQLEGPYRVTTLVDVLYPPTALLLFVPFTVAPPVVWWIIPMSVLAITIASWRPAMWSVPIMLALCLWVRAFGAFLWGNTDMWMAAAVAGGLRWGWPAVLIMVKPSLLPFIFVGIKRRSLLVAVIALTLGSIAVFWPLWLDYVQAIRNMEMRLDYSLGSVTLLLVPVVAWFARDRAIEEGRAS